MLKGEFVSLRPLQDSDATELFCWINERKEVLSNAPYKPVHEAQHREWLSSLQHRSDLFIFGISRLADSKLIGTCQLHGVSPVHGSAEMQIRIGDVSSRGKGYGREAIRLLLKFGFHDLNLHRIFLHVFAGNSQALATYEKAGFAREGVFREAALIDGGRQDIIAMAILRREFDGS